MLHDDWFQRVAYDTDFNFAVRYGEAVVLPLMFGPGIHNKRFQIDIRSFRIVVNSPPCGAVAATNSLIFVYLFQEIRRLRRINHIFHGNQNRPEIRGGLLEHLRRGPVIPFTEDNGRVRKPKRELKQHGCGNSDGRYEKGRTNTCALGRDTPECASDRHAALKYEKIG